MKYKLELASNDNQTLACFDVLVQLYPKLNKEILIDTIDHQSKNSYKLLLAYDGDDVVAVTRFRIGYNFSVGKYIYIENMATDEEYRSLGIGASMIDWIENFAKDNSCKQIRLISATHRHKAHKFYLNQNFKIACYNFWKDV
ncbi:MAG: GNAT family N-acetyltransferase [uncultured Campylobacterales bacterium]|uniref:GNAT family N-acetyltransferase n=1 Tax=uncultured Campylobacterales bacterium TaxID=352960 RepID=A0A6S6SKI8_9BACT|nr:MAG: GNAT family N-acetyltransferase [uncultured Campylobacterales bacterium]